MQYFKLQIGCMLIVLYVAFIYIREKYEYKVKQKEPVFELLLITGILSIVFDGATAYTVNYLDKVPGLVNAVLHACFLCGLDTLSFVIFLYMYDITRGVPKSRKIKTLIILPLAICIAVVILFMPQLEYRSGRITNYSMGISAYTCFIMVAVYMLGTVILLVKGWRNMGHHKLITLTTCIAAANVVTIYQMIYPESLISCLVPTFVIIGSYLNVENPLFTKLQAHNREMVMGFATLVENRDGSTGGHIRRTTTYVKLLAEELQKRGISTVANNTLVSVAAFDKWRSNIMFRSFVKAAKGIYIHHELYIAEKKNKSISVNVYKEYVLYRNGEWFIIEINLRWSGMTTTTAAMEGRNPLAIFVDSILGTDKNYSMKRNLKYALNFKMKARTQEELVRLYENPHVDYIMQLETTVTGMEKINYCEVVISTDQGKEDIRNVLNELGEEFPGLVSDEVKANAGTLIQKYE